MSLQPQGISYTVWSHNFSLKWPGSSLHLSKANENAHGNMTSGSVLVCGLPVSDVIDERIQRLVRMEPVSTAHIPACTRPQHCDTSMAHLAERTNHTLKWCLVCELNHCLWCLDCGSFFKVIKCLNMIFLSLLAEHFKCSQGWWNSLCLALLYEVWICLGVDGKFHAPVLWMINLREPDRSSWADFTSCGSTRYGGIFFSSLCT